MSPSIDGRYMTCIIYVVTILLTAYAHPYYMSLQAVSLTGVDKYIFKLAILVLYTCHV